MPLAALTVGLLFLPRAAKAYNFGRAVTNNASLTVWLSESQNSEKQTVQQTDSELFSFFWSPRKEIVQLKDVSGHFRKSLAT